MLIEIVPSERGKQLRTEPRMKVMLTGELSSRRGLFACRVVDISRGGACLDTECRHDVGEEVCFRRGALETQGRIVWSRGRRFGIRFDEPIRATELFVQMSHSRGAARAPPPARPQLSAAVPLSPSR